MTTHCIHLLPYNGVASVLKKVTYFLYAPFFRAKAPCSKAKSKRTEQSLPQEKLVYEREDFWATTSNKQLTNLSGKNLNSRNAAGPEGVSLRDETNSFVPIQAQGLSLSAIHGLRDTRHILWLDRQVLNVKPRALMSTGLFFVRM